MKRWLFLFICAVILMSLACNFGGLGGDSGDEEPAGTSDSAQPPAGQTTDPPSGGEDEPGSEPSVAGAERPDAEPSAEVGLEAVNSYRARRLWRGEFADGTVEEVLVEDEMLRTPPAYHTLTRISRDEYNETIEAFHLGQDHWTLIDGEWIQNQTPPLRFEDNQTLFYFADASELVQLGDFGEAGRDTTNGMPTRRYQAQSFPATQSALYWVITTQSGFSMSDNISDLKNVRDEIWVADRPDLPPFAVKRIREAEAKDASGQVIRYSDTVEVYELNTVFTIEPPAAAGPTWPPADLPVYPNATIDSSMSTPGGGVIILVSPDDFETVTDWYAAQLAAAGWAQTESNQPAEGMLMDTWTRAAQIMTLLINAEGKGSRVTMTIAPE